MQTDSPPRDHHLPLRQSWWASAGLLAALAALVLLTARYQHASADEQPPFLFPWQDGVAWQTGMAGFHSANDALDFFPPDTAFNGVLHCTWEPDWTFQESDYWILASAPGTVAQVEEAYVLIDHGNGWFSRYYHLAEPQVEAGDPVAAGQRLGHPSTLGDCSTGPHVHFWVQGPSGQTTKNVSLSGLPTMLLEPNQWITDTDNFDVTVEPTPTPTAGPSPTATTPGDASPTTMPTESPTPTASPTPAPVIGDANCDGLVTLVDAMFILRYAAELDAAGCTPLTANVNCDNEVSVADAAVVLQAAVSGALSVPTCAPLTELVAGAPPPP